MTTKSYLDLPATFPIGVRRNNPGNLAKGRGGYAGITTRPDTKRGGDFYAFIDMPHGFLALIQVVQSYIGKGYNTLNKFAPRYAPAKLGNDVPLWISQVGKYAGIKSANALLPTDPAGLKQLVMAIVKKETGLKFTKGGKTAIIEPSDYDGALALLAQESPAVARAIYLNADGVAPGWNEG